MKAAQKVEVPAVLPDDRYLGKFVALRSFADKTVIAAGRNAERVVAAARRKGVASPVVFFVPKEDMICLY
jgi:hypothetical protein